MREYVIRLPAENGTGDQTVTFSAISFTAALDEAKDRATGDWAELSSDGRILARMRLVSEEGVWLVEPNQGGDHISDCTPAQ